MHMPDSFGMLWFTIIGIYVYYKYSNHAAIASHVRIRVITMECAWCCVNILYKPALGLYNVVYSIHSIVNILATDHESKAI